MTNVMVLGGRASGKCLGHEGILLMNGIHILVKQTPQRSLDPSAMWGYTRSATWKRTLTHRAGKLISDFQPPKLWEINFCCLWATQSVVFCHSSLNRLRQYHTAWMRHNYYHHPLLGAFLYICLLQIMLQWNPVFAYRYVQENVMFYVSLCTYASIYVD